MNVEAITMEPAEATRRLREVRAALHKKADDEYLALERAYVALAKGRPIIELGEAIQLGGTDAKGRPNFAVARADRRTIAFEWAAPTHVDSPDGGEAVFRQTDNGDRTGRDYVLRVPMRVPRESVKEVWQTGYRTRWRGHALVPMVPPEVKNAVRFDARKCLILWEVEQWAETPIHRRPDIDPLLLRRLAPDSNTCAVLAAWDLTPLERLVLAGRGRA